MAAIFRQSFGYVWTWNSRDEPQNFIPSPEITIIKRNQRLLECLDMKPKKSMVYLLYSDNKNADVFFDIVIITSFEV